MSRLLLTWATLAAMAFSATSRAALGPVNIAPDLAGYKQVCYVSQATGSDASGDGTRAKPWATIAGALGRVASLASDHRCAILVAASTYGDAIIELKPYVDLFGGYSKDDWSRDIFKNSTIIDGQQARRLVIGADNARIDGFVIRGGRSTGPGGAILCKHTSPTIANNIIVDNLAVEPADYAYGMMHQVGSDGGGIACIDGSHAVIINNIIARNTTNIGGGGGIGVRNYSMPTIENNVICDNRTGLKDNDPDLHKRARSSNGGGISLSVAASLTARDRIANNLISGNRVSGNSDGGGIYCEFDSSPDILDNFLLNNASEDDGAAIYVMKLSEPFIAGNTLAGNHGHGTIRLSKEGRGRIHDNVFFSNPAGGVLCVDSWMLCSNNTIANNPGGGISYINRHTASMKPAVILNNILYGNGSNKVSSESTDAPRVSHCDIQGGAGGEGNFDADPQFASDGSKGAIAGISYDPNRVQTIIALTESLRDPASCLGRVVRVGDQWGLVASANDHQLVAWGDLRNEKKDAAAQFEIAPTYRLSDSSPCLGKGMAIPEGLAGPGEQAKIEEFDKQVKAMAQSGRINVGATVHAPARQAEAAGN